MEGNVHSGFPSPHDPVRTTQVHVNVLVCHICLAPPTDPVLTVCGHLFCWPCLYEWLHQGRSKTCPLCRFELREDISITPVYGGSPETTGTSTSSAEHEGAMIHAGPIPKRPAPPFGSSLESLQSLSNSGPDSSRFVFRSAAVEEVEAWKRECERLQTLLDIHKGRLQALERQLNRGEYRLGRDLDERGSRSD